MSNDRAAAEKLAIEHVCPNTLQPITVYEINAVRHLTTLLMKALREGARLQREACSDKLHKMAENTFLETDRWALVLDAVWALESAMRAMPLITDSEDGDGK